MLRKPRRIILTLFYIIFHSCLFGHIYNAVIFLLDEISLWTFDFAVCFSKVRAVHFWIALFILIAANADVLKAMVADSSVFEPER